jgi:putative endonuclease
MAGWVYMLRCSDGSLYVGSTSQDDIETRIAEHNNGKFEGFTSKRRPVTLVWSDWYQDLRDAQNMERQIKGWRREKKLALIRGDSEALHHLAKRPKARRPSRPVASEQ